MILVLVFFFVLGGSLKRARHPERKLIRPVVAGHQFWQPPASLVLASIAVHGSGRLAYYFRILIRTAGAAAKPQNKQWLLAKHPPSVQQLPGSKQQRKRKPAGARI